MKYFIIGGTGIISTSIVSQLLEEDHEVVIFNRGNRENIFKDKVKHIIGDKQDTSLLRSTLINEEPNILIDMVCFNKVDAQKLIEATNNIDLHCFVCSTVLVYGSPMKYIPTDEDHEYSANSNAGYNKAQMEKEFIEANKSELKFTILRPGHTTGKGDPLIGMLFDSMIIDRIQNGEQIILPDNGIQKRMITHIDDVAKAFILASQDDSTKGEIYNVANFKTHTWKEIYLKIAEHLKIKELNFVNIDSNWLIENLPKASLPLKYFYKDDWIIDSSKAQLSFNYCANKDLEDIISDQINWFLNNRETLQDIETFNYKYLIDSWINKTEVNSELLNDTNPWGNIEEI